MAEPRKALPIVHTTDPELSFWPTPPEIAHDVVFQALQPWHCLGEGVRVLEPSAGVGHLARAVREHLPQAHITCLEPDAERVTALHGTGLADEVIKTTLEDYLTSIAVDALFGSWEPYHLVIMNPPFTLAGRPEAWAEHILALYNDPNILAPGGVISAIVPQIVMTGKSRRVRAIRDLLVPYYGVEACEVDAFAPTGAAVSTALLWIEKEG